MNPTRNQKLWVIAKRRSNQTTQQRANLSIETCYMQVLRKVLDIVSQTKSPYFERNYRLDTGSILAMHALLTESFYWYLECSLTYSHRIEYAFYKCPFEAEIQARLRNNIYSMNTKEVQLKPDFNTFYKNVLNFQPTQYLFNR